MNDQLRKAVVGILKKQTGKERVVNGPGFFVSPKGHILTCFHTIEGQIQNGGVKIVLPDDSIVEAKLEKHAREADLALLKAEAQFAPKWFFNIRSSQHAYDKDFVTYGFPEKLPGGMWGYGKVRNHTRNYVQLSSMELRPGFSGGPVVIGGTNEVIGIVKSQYSNQGVIAHFCIPGEKILQTFDHLKPSYTLFADQDLYKYKCLIIQAPWQNEEVESFVIRSDQQGFQDRMVFKTLTDIFPGSSKMEPRLQQEKEKFFAAVEQSNCVILWVCGVKFFPIFKILKEKLLNSPLFKEKEIVLINVGEEEGIFQQQYQNILTHCHYFPGDSSMFKRYNLTSLNKLKHALGSIDSVYFELLNHLDTDVVSFKKNLLKNLQTFNFNKQVDIVLETIDSEEKLFFFALQGGEHCGLEILARRISHVFGPGSTDLKVLDFEAVELGKFDAIQSFIKDYLQKETQPPSENWVADLYQHPDRIFFVFQNFIGPGCTPVEFTAKEAVLAELLAFFEKNPPPATWQGQCIFLIINKAAPPYPIPPHHQNLTVLPPVTKLNTALGQKEVGSWHDGLKLPDKKVSFIKAHTPSTPEVGKFLFEICRNLGVEDVYHQQLAKLQ